MTKRAVRLKQIFQPSDTTAFVVIALGLFIALFLDEMAVRLIGVCIAVLGGVALFMMVSPRLTDLSMMRPPRPSDSPNINSETKKNENSVSTVFDKEAYEKNFGSNEQGEEDFHDPTQGLLFTQESAPNPIKVPVFEGGGDDSSSVRIVGTRPKTGARPVAKPPTLVIDSKVREARPGFNPPQTLVAAAVQDKPFSTERQQRPDRTFMPDRTLTPERATAMDSAGAPVSLITGGAVITGPIDSEIQLSDDVVIRPMSKPSAGTTKPPVTAPTAQPPRITIDDANTVGPDSGDEEQNFDGVTSEVVVAGGVAADAVVAGGVAADAVVAGGAVTDEVVADGPLADEVVADGPVVARTVKPSKRRAPEVSVNVFTDDTDEELGTFEEPRKEFDYLLNKVLMVIRSATNARTAAFFWVNHEKQQLVLESKITEAKDAFIEHRKIPIGRDAVSQIATDNRPEILSQISPSAELDLIPYYRSRTGTVSFVGVPVYYANKVIGVLCADSLEEDAYSEVTVGFFGHFTKLISGLVTSYTSKFDLLQASKTLDAIQLFKENTQDSALNIPDLTTALFDSVVRTLDVNTVGLCLFDSTKNSWFVADIQSVVDGYEDIIGAEIDIESSTVGHCISSGKTVISASAPGVVRVVDAESTMEDGQFVAIPLRTADRTFGALYFENHLSTLSPQDISITESVAAEAGMLIKEIYNRQMLRESALLDYSTGVLNRDGFDMRLREEFARAIDYQLPLTVCVIRIDKSKIIEEAPAEHFETMVLSVLNTIKNQLRDYDVVGRIGRGTVAIGLVAYKAADAQLWTDNLRRDIASNVIEIENKRFSLTVSIGIAQANPRDDWSALTKNALLVLAESEKIGNKVTVFN
ncbi:MAG: GAF domain-containing protein [Ignavibacteria bacterium]|nr:GAF domain-containing protein [Ignavibacteria bacterium]